MEEQKDKPQNDKTIKGKTRKDRERKLQMNTETDKKGTLYGIGLGPGDPELMTLKAVRLIRACDVIAAPGKAPRESVAYRIAVQSVPEIADKEVLALDMPMTTDEEKLRAAHAASAAAIKQQLDAGKDVAYITLGDPTIYCTFSYLQHLLEEEGCTAELVSGIPSFCAAAARLGIPLVEWDEPLHVIPAVHKIEKTADTSERPELPETHELQKTAETPNTPDTPKRQDIPSELELPGTCVLMKSASRIGEVREALRQSGRDVQAVIDCGMETELLCRNVEEIPENAGYFTLIIAKENKEW